MYIYIYIYRSVTVATALALTTSGIRLSTMLLATLRMAEIRKASGVEEVMLDCAAPERLVGLPRFGALVGVSVLSVGAAAFRCNVLRHRRRYVASTCRFVARKVLLTYCDFCLSVAVQISLKRESRIPWTESAGKLLCANGMNILCALLYFSLLDQITHNTSFNPNPGPLNTCSSVCFGTGSQARHSLRECGIRHAKQGSVF